MPQYMSMVDWQRIGDEVDGVGGRHRFSKIVYSAWTGVTEVGASVR
jgi:hypothetical protein